MRCQPCNTDLSYSDSVIRFKLIAGLSDEEIKEEILSSQEDKNLEETVKEIEAKESGKLARKTLGADVDRTPRVENPLRELTNIDGGKRSKTKFSCDLSVPHLEAKIRGQKKMKPGEGGVEDSEETENNTNISSPGEIK